MRPPPRSSKGGTFGAFLKEVKRRKEGGPSSQSMPVSLLEFLDDSPRSVMEVMKQSGLSLQEFAAALQNMSEEGRTSSAIYPITRSR